MIWNLLLLKISFWMCIFSVFVSIKASLFPDWVTLEVTRCQIDDNIRTKSKKLGEDLKKVSPIWWGLAGGPHFLFDIMFSQKCRKFIHLTTNINPLLISNILCFEFDEDISKLCFYCYTFLPFSCNFSKSP